MRVGAAGARTACTRWGPRWTHSHTASSISTARSTSLTKQTACTNKILYFQYCSLNSYWYLPIKSNPAYTIQYTLYSIQHCSTEVSLWQQRDTRLGMSMFIIHAFSFFSLFQFFLKTMHCQNHRMPTVPKQLIVHFLQYIQKDYMYEQLLNQFKGSKLELLLNECFGFIQAH